MVIKDVTVCNDNDTKMIHRKDDIFLGDDTNKGAFDFVFVVDDDEVAIAEDVDQRDTILIFVLISVLPLQLPATSIMSLCTRDTGLTTR